MQTDILFVPRLKDLMTRLQVTRQSSRFVFSSVQICDPPSV